MRTALLGCAAAPPHDSSKGASLGTQVVCKGHKGKGHGVYAAKCEGKTTTVEKDGAVVSVCEGLFKNFGKVAKAINDTDKEFTVGHLTGQCPSRHSLQQLRPPSSCDDSLLRFGRHCIIGPMGAILSP